MTGGRMVTARDRAIVRRVVRARTVFAAMRSGVVGARIARAVAARCHRVGPPIVARFEEAAELDRLLARQAADLVASRIACAAVEATLERFEHATHRLRFAHGIAPTGRLSVTDVVQELWQGARE